MKGAPPSAPIVITALFGPEDHAFLNDLRRRHYPPERNHLDAHLTMFHHLPPSAEADVRARLANFAAGRAPRAELSGMMNLGRGVAFAVRSPELEAIREDLAQSFHGLLTPQDAGGWRPHVTIQNKAQPADVKRLHGELDAAFVPRPLAIAGLACFHYRGGPWEPIGRYPFRGGSV